MLQEKRLTILKWIREKRFFLISFLIIWFIFAYTRYQGEYTTYIPLSRKVFNIQPTEIAHITITQYLPEDDELKGKRYDTPEELSEITSRLNQIRYWFWMPQLPSFIQTGGGDEDDYWITIQSVDLMMKPVRFEISAGFLYAYHVKYSIGIDGVEKIVYDLEHPS